MFWAVPQLVPLPTRKGMMVIPGSETLGVLRMIVLIFFYRVLNLGWMWMQLASQVICVSSAKI